MPHPARSPADDTPPAQIIDLVFPIKGQRVPADHGYDLYAALCHAVPEVHGAPWLAVHPIRGTAQVDGTLRLPLRPTLTLRLPATQIPAVLPLANQLMVLREHRFYLGMPAVQPLQPAPSLDARLVAIRLTQVPRGPDGAIDQDAFALAYRAELSRQLAALDVTAEVTLTGRQHVRVHQQRILGWSVRLSGLSDAASLLVQARGLGGKRAMGCGVFQPTRARP